MQSSLDGVRILLIEDDALTLELFQFILQESGADVRACLSVREATAALDSWIPELVVSDIGLPGEDGFSLIRKLRGELTTRNVPAIAVTGYASKEDTLELNRAGYQAVLSKPVDPYSLIKAVETVIKKST